MDRVIEKTKAQKLKKYWPYMAGAAFILVIGSWLLFGNHASTLRVNKDELTISDVQRAEFKDYVRTNGQVLPIQVVHPSGMPSTTRISSSVRPFAPVYTMPNALSMLYGEMNLFSVSFPSLRV